MSHPETVIAMNVASTADSLADDATAYVQDPTDANRGDMIAGMRIMVHRIGVAMQVPGEEPSAGSLHDSLRIPKIQRDDPQHVEPDTDRSADGKPLDCS